MRFDKTRRGWITHFEVAESVTYSVLDDGGVSDSYWDTETSNQETSAGELGRTTAEMTYPYAANTYTGWDLVHTWGADSDYLYNDGYPYLPLPAGNLL